MTSDGDILDGDDILYILSKEIPANSGVVGTLMTNKALELYFQNEGIEFSRADVGDKYVLQRLIERSWVLGGEPSGHIICLDSAPTGDAIVAALKFLNATKDKGFSVEKSLEGFKKFPQTLINLKVNNPNKIIISDKFWEKVTEIELQLGEDGRVLIRPSGTEPLIRIMVESKDSGISENLCNSLLIWRKEYDSSQLEDEWVQEEVDSWLRFVSTNILTNKEIPCVFCPPSCYLDYSSSLIKKFQAQLNLALKI